MAPDPIKGRLIGDRLVQAGVEARVGDVRLKPGSTRLFVRLHSPTDLAQLQQELGALWRDYQRLN
jgi:hypothetical protein